MNSSGVNQRLLDGSNIIHLTNIERHIWKDINKAALISYYNSISDYILPHLQDWPISLHIKNLRATAPRFFIKDMEGREIEFVEIFRTPRKHRKKRKVQCDQLPGLQ